MQSLSSEAIGKIASSLGLDQTMVQRAINAGIPGILAGLTHAASTPGGAERLGSAVSQIEDAPGHDIVRNVLESNRKTAADSGWSMLSSLLGGSSLQTLSSILAQFAGFGQGSAKGLLGLLAPVVIGFLRHEQVSSGLDSKGLASLLSSQRPNIERAMPASFAQSLQDAGFGTASQPAQPVFRRQAPGAAQSSSSSNWLYWLLPALIIAGAALYLLPNRQENRTAEDTGKNTTTVAKQAETTAPQAAPGEQVASKAAAALTPAVLENDIVANIGRLRNALQTIKDPGSARAALGELKEITGQFSRLKERAQQLSPDARKALAAAVASRVPDLNALIDRISSEMNKSVETKPDMDTLKSELIGVTKA
jgi:hypothetical protein